MTARTVVALALLAVVAAPGAAHATSVRVDETYEDDRFDVYSTYALTITANAREANRIVLRELRDGTYVVEDRGTRRPIIVGSECRRTSRIRAVCRPKNDLEGVTVELRERDDRFSVRGRRGVSVTVDGGPGADRISSQRTPLEARGSSGNDMLIGSTAGDGLDGGTGRDLLRGDGGADELVGGPGADRVLGGSGDDTMDGNDLTGAVRDTLDGGRGSDTVTYEDRRSRVRVDLVRQRGGRGGTEDRYRSVENAMGGDGDDLLLGNDRANVLVGGEGEDEVSGRGGDDDLSGARVRGGAGDDRLTYTDRRSDCGTGTDRVLRPEEVQVYVPRSCERLATAFAPVAADAPARPVAVTDSTITFELVGVLAATRDRRLRLLDPSVPAATANAAPLADVAVPDGANYARVRVDVPRTGALAPTGTPRRLEVVVDARIPGFRPLPPDVRSREAYRIDLDL